MTILSVILFFGLLIVLCMWFLSVKENKKLRSMLEKATNGLILTSPAPDPNPTPTPDPAPAPAPAPAPTPAEKQDLKSTILIEDLTKLINKKLPKKTEYIKFLDNIDMPFLNKLDSLYQGALSQQYSKYCVCFAIGMEISEVSECFSIEQSSVHMVRYRMKKKFGLSNHDDLDLFLRQQLA